MSDTPEGMSAQNVEVVRRLYEAWSERGFGVIEELMDPDIEYVNPPYAVEPGTHRGYAGFRAAAEAFTSIYGDYAVTPTGMVDAGDRIVVTARVATRSTANAVPIEETRGFVFDVRDGLITRFAWCADPAEALAQAHAAEP